jgi:hypothetical protein
MNINLPESVKLVELLTNKIEELEFKIEELKENGGLCNCQKFSVNNKPEIIDGSYLPCADTINIRMAVSSYLQKDNQGFHVFIRTKDADKIFFNYHLKTNSHKFLKSDIATIISNAHEMLMSELFKWLTDTYNSTRG